MSAVGRSEGLESVLDEAFGVRTTSRFCSFYFLGYMMNSALLIIGSVGAAGKFPVRSMGRTVTILATGSYASILAAGNLGKRKCELFTMGLAAITFLVLGVLSIKGVLSLRQTGFGVMGTALTANVIVTYLLMSGIASLRNRPGSVR